MKPHIFPCRLLAAQPRGESIVAPTVANALTTRGVSDQTLKTQTLNPTPQTLHLNLPSLPFPFISPLTITVCRSHFFFKTDLIENE